MKKFLTVLLALSVVFTYSFGTVSSVFAAAADADQSARLDKAEAYAKGQIDANLDRAITEMVDANTGVSATFEISADAWNTK